MNAILVTACPAGVASSMIAAELLKKAAREQQWQVSLECQTQFSTSSLSAEQIAAADIVVVVGLAADMARFAGKALYHASLEECFADPATLVTTAIAKASEYQPAKQVTAKASTSGQKRIVGITACPTGVAHTFMAAEAITDYAKANGMAVKIETRGSVGAKNALTDEDIANADLVFIAADIDVDLSRFAGKPLYRTSTGAALKKTKEEMERAFASATPYQAEKNSTKAAKSNEKTGVYKHLMTGVSFMLPMVVAGGLSIALSFVFGIEAFKVEGSFAAALMKIGGDSALALMVPVLAGYIAFSIADRPGLAPGLIGGMLASSLGAGFLGGIVAGFLAGYSAKLIADKVHLPDSMAALKPILLIPLIASLFTGLVMIYLVGEPVADIMRGLTHFLDTMGSTNAVLLGVILGAMMCVDLGGPVNKAAYAFGVGLLASQSYAPMAAIMAAGMVPPLAMGLATMIAKRKFLPQEQESGKAAFVLGLCFISEGAIPFAARDPMRVIPACIAGGALTGGLSMLVGAKLMAPHGGIFVLFIPHAIQPVLLYLLAIAAGTLLTAFIYAFIKPSESVATAA